MAYLRKYHSIDLPEDQELPFKIKFNFEKMIAYWQEIAKSEKVEALGAKALLDRIEKKAPALFRSFDDYQIIADHEQEIKALLSPLFPTLTTHNAIEAVFIPFVHLFFNVTKRLCAILDAAGENCQLSMRNEDNSADYINACIFILNFKYNAQINNKKAIYLDITNQETGILRHYRAFINADFSSFIPNDSFQPLTKEEIKELIDNFDNIELWKEKIPPNSFTYEGFSIVKLFDVTEDEAISALKVDLLKKDALQSEKAVEDIRHHLSSFLGIDGLKLGFAAYDKEKDTIKSLGYGLWNRLSLSDELEIGSKSAFCHSSHSCLFQNKHALVYSDCKENVVNNPLLSKLSENTIKSYIALPLKYNEEVVGIFELGSQKINELNAITAKRLEQIIPLFTTALMRSVDELETKVEAIVQQQFTAIHPTVSWRFFDAAENLLKRNQSDSKAIIEDIAFPDVYPLYGQSDIKDSSVERNNAIRADMIEQLTLAQTILNAAIDKYHLPIYNQLKFKLEDSINQIKKGLGAGDEVEVLEFLKQDIDPVFRYFKTLDADMDALVEVYKKALNEDLGVIYNKRGDYEQSVQLINNAISEYIEKAQINAQQMFPHYFEKYKTDGVEHNMYIGQSMVNNKKFNELHLQNLRLWQLMTICEVENLMEFTIKPQLRVPLSVASLILVHHNPITIQFRQEEKRFDVEGAYNIRYEIIKKRIDKATIKGTTERLTQVGKIAIVYSQDKEAREYRQYLSYLQSINYIKETIEWLDLNDLQGVTGLKAIRVAVKYPTASRMQGKRKRKVIGSY